MPKLVTKTFENHLLYTKSTDTASIFCSTQRKTLFISMSFGAGAKSKRPRALKVYLKGVSVSVSAAYRIQIEAFKQKHQKLQQNICGYRIFCFLFCLFIFVVFCGTLSHNAA